MIYRRAEQISRRAQTPIPIENTLDVTHLDLALGVEWTVNAAPSISLGYSGCYSLGFAHTRRYRKLRYDHIETDVIFTTKVQQDQPIERSV